MLAESAFPRMISLSDLRQAETLLHAGKIVVMPTDTLYGLVGLASKPEVVDRIYKVKNRLSGKPFIVLISDVKELERFGVVLDREVSDFLGKHWPGPVSVVFPVSREFEYLHRGKGSLAFRLPNKKDLVSLLSKTGPLVAPSANPEGESPAATIDAARNYFDGEVDFYIDGGTLDGKASKLVEYRDGTFITLRE